jgi:hypothetical protein
VVSDNGLSHLLRNKKIVRGPDTAA